MKKIAVFIFTTFNFLCLGQQKGTISIGWTENKQMSFGDFSLNVPSFSEENYQYIESSKELFFVKKFKESSLIDENSLQITNVVFESIDGNQLNSISKNEMPATVFATLKNSIARNQYYSVLTLSPFIKEGNSYKKIISFDYSYVLINSSRLTNQNNVLAITNSVLSSGNWYRFYIEKSGAHYISRTFLSELGINPDNVNPKKIKIYGHGGRMAPLRNSDPYPFDLEENAIQVVGEDDFAFNAEDYIVFYAEAMDNWSAENSTHINLYSDRSYYYINVEGEDGKRITSNIQPTASTTLPLNTFDDYQFHEVDLTNIGRLGRIWFGESFSPDNEQEFNFSFPNAVTSTQATIGIHVGGNSFVSTKFTPTINGAAQSNLNLNIITLNSSSVASHTNGTYTVPTAQNFNVRLNFDNGGVPTSKGYLDYIYISTKSNLTGYGKQFRFQYNNAVSSTGIAEYQFNNATNIKEIWDITDIYNVTKIQNQNQANFSFKSNLGVAKKYIAIDFNDLYLPQKEQQTRVANQDLKGTIFLNAQGNFQDVDYLIITPSGLTTQAEKLANFHRNYSGLNVKVVQTELI